MSTTTDITLPLFAEAIMRVLVRTVIFGAYVALGLIIRLLLHALGVLA